MFIGEFILKMGTTRDTVRYYIEENLLLPEKKAGKYWFSPTEIADFQGIRELRQLAFTINMIKQVLTSKRSGCGTHEHVLFIQQLVEAELLTIEKTKAELALRQETLKSLLQETDSLATKNGVADSNLS